MYHGHLTHGRFLLQKGSRPARGGGTLSLHCTALLSLLAFYGFLLLLGPDTLSAAPVVCCCPLAAVLSVRMSCPYSTDMKTKTQREMGTRSWPQFEGTGSGWIWPDALCRPSLSVSCHSLFSLLFCLPCMSVCVCVCVLLLCVLSCFEPPLSMSVRGHLCVILFPVQRGFFFFFPSCCKGGLRL